MAYLCEMENVGLIVVGRVVTTEFENVDQIKSLSELVSAEGEKHGVDAELIYCNTTINWPEDFQYVDSVIGIVTHASFAGGDDEYGGYDDEEPEPISASALEARNIPAEFWTRLQEAFPKLVITNEDAAYVAVAGWAWTAIKDANGASVGYATAEDEGYTRINLADLKAAPQPLTMSVSYC